jgi:peptide/nickel transport system substrate-binding protein
MDAKSMTRSAGRKEPLGDHWANRSRLLALGFAFALLATACGPGTSAPPSDQSAGRTGTKSITIPVLNAVPGFSLGFGGTSPTGGWLGLTEVHTNGLLTTEATSRQRVGLLAERVPSLDDGSVTLLPDGRMRVVWMLRRGVTWHDGTPFTAHDLVFSTRVLQDEGLPRNRGEAIPERTTSAEALDDQTFVVVLKSPYFQAVSHGLVGFWPLPQHILSGPYERYRASGNVDDLMLQPYWTSEYVHLGPFQVTSFDPSGTISFQAYDGYFRGRPKLDAIRIHVFLSSNTLFANVLTGDVQLFLESTVEGDEALQLIERWRASGEGRVHAMPSNIRVLTPQFRPAYLSDPSLLDKRVRIALSHALNREELAQVFSGTPDAAAYTALLRNDPLYEAAKDIFRPYAYDPARARAVLGDAGWVFGADGKPRYAVDGRVLHTSITVTPGSDREGAAVAGLWRAIGVEVDELVVPPAMTSNREVRSTYPAWELSSGSYISKLRGPPATTENRWVGGRAGYDDPRLDGLVHILENTVSDREQFQAMRAIGEYIAEEVPLLPVAYNVHYLGVRKGVRALNDTEGGDGAVELGSYSRNAHLWDLE